MHVKKIKVGVLFFLLPVINFAQESIITLDKNYTGTHEKVARNSIFMKPGFSYTATGSDYFWAHIDPGLPYPPISEATYLDQQDLPAHDQSLPVGAIPGEASISLTGAANYTIPIEMPPAAKGMQPNLSLVYNSQAGNGIMGVGWNLSGLSAISRVPKNIYNDGKVEKIKLDNTDNFALDGNRLLWDDGAGAYKTELDTYVKITPQGSSVGAPLWFKAETKDGLTLEYGNSVGARVTKHGIDDQILEWKISKVSDNFGNTIIYEWDDLEDSYRAGLLKNAYLSNIRYGSNSVEGNESYNVVHFDYAIRGDVTTLIYDQIGKISNHFLLQDIEITCESDFVKSYHLDYINDGMSKLKTISLSGNDGDQLNKSVIDWGKETFGKLLNPNLLHQEVPNRIALDTEVTGADFDGDGKVDFLYKSDELNNWKVYILSNPYDPEYVEKDNRSLDGIYQVFSADIDNDGKSSLFLVEDVKNSNNLLKEYSYDSGSGQLVLSKTTTLPSEYTQHVLFGDFDGDMEQDILAYDGNKNIRGIILAKDGELLSVQHSSNPKTIELGDINGDGKTDVIVVNSDGKASTYEYSGNTILSEIGDQLRFLESNPIYLKGEFDGDNRTDFLCFDDGSWKIHRTISGHNGFTTDSSMPLSAQAPGGFYNVFVTDLNHDGFDDILELKEEKTVTYNYNAEVSKTINYHINNGNGKFRTSSYHELGFHDPYLSRCFVVYDVNGNGMEDLIDMHNFPVNGGYSYKNFIYQTSHYVNYYLVSEIKDGLLKSTAFAYSRPLSVQTKNSESFIQYLNRPPIYTTSKLTVQSESTIFRDQTYTYSNPYLHKQGRGFLGFEKLVREDNLSGRITTYNRKLNTDFYYFPLEGISETSYDGSPISEITYINAFLIDEATKRFWPYVIKTTERDNLRNTTNTFVSLYDDYGNPSVLTADYNGDATVTTENEYTSFGNWCFPKSRLRQSTVTKTRPEEQDFKTSTWYDYNNNGALITKKSFYNQQKEVTETYSQFDNFGNPWAVTVSSSGEQSRETLFKYENYGRFIKEQTNPEGHVTGFTNDGKTGNLLSQLDENGFETRYKYDGFGRLEKVTFPDEHIAEFSRHWQIDDGTAWYEKIKIGGQPEQRKYYDSFGRMAKTETGSFENGSMVVSEVKYKDGRLWKTFEPYDSNAGATSLCTENFYKPDGRIDHIIHPNAVTDTYSYNGNSTTVSSSNGFSRTTVTDGTGAVMFSEDEGGTISYAYFASGNLKSVTAPTGEVVEMTYDDYGRQDLLKDPDAGTVDYDYDAFGELTRQTDNKGNSYDMVYDRLGRLKTKSGNDGSRVSYNYDTAENGIGKLESVNGSNDISYSYQYDDLGRLLVRSENVEGRHFSVEYGYDGNSALSRIIYPETGYVVENLFQNGYLQQVKGTLTNTTSLFTATAYNQRGQIEAYNLGNGLTTNRGFDDFGYPTTIKTTGIQDLEYHFDSQTGNLGWRKDNVKNLREDFTYDNLMKNRLETWQVNSGIQYTTTYKVNGNIGTKSGLGSYSYEDSPPHAVTKIDNTDNLISMGGQHISYTPFNKVESIEEGENTLEITYGPDNSRKKAKFFTNGILQKTTYYIGGVYEVEVNEVAGSERKLHYISGGDGLAAIFEKTSSTEKLYYIHKDHLGSFQAISDDAGNLLQEMSFDPWGNRRNPVDWSYNNVPANYLFNRGFTGHEHLDNFALVNMNGRFYDPLLGRMLSPDNYIQMPDYTQSFNRYSYCLNNPLKYTDPSGQLLEGFFGNLFAAWVGNYAIGVADNWINRGMPLGKAIAATPISASINYSPSMNYVSNYQVDAKTSAAHLVKYSDELDQELAGYRNMGNVASNGGGSWLSDTWDWTKDHFYAGVEGEITYGAQLAGGVKKGLNVNLNIASQVVAEGKWSTHGSYANSYSIQPMAYADKGKVLDFGGSYIGGGNYNWNVENGKWVSSTLSLGVFGVGGNLTWDKNGVSNLFVGFELGTKWAVGWGAAGSGKVGFNWDW